jgi:DNA-directed RNA polymerase specialized sigma24 family protein
VSALLDLVSEARDLRDTANREFRRALVRANEGGHSLREIAEAAGINFSAVRGHLLRERERSAHDE